LLSLVVKLKEKAKTNQHEYSSLFSLFNAS